MSTKRCLFILICLFFCITQCVYADTVVTKEQIDTVINWANQKREGYGTWCGAYVFDAFSKNGYNFFPSSRARCAYGKNIPGDDYCTSSMLDLVDLPLHKTDMDQIPRGAIVFYGREDLYCYGHVGIYDGNGHLCQAYTGDYNTGCFNFPQTVTTSYCYDANGNNVKGSNAYTTYQGWSFWKGYDLYSEKKYGTLDLNGVLDGINNGGIHGFGTVNVYLNDSLVAESVGDYWNSTIPEGTTYRIDNIKAYNGFSYDGVAKGSLTGTIAADSTIDVQLKFNTNPDSGRSAESATLWAERGITGDDNIIGTINGYNYRDNAVTLSYLVFDAYHIKRVTQPNDFVASGTIKIQNTEDAGSTNMPEGWNKAPRGAILVWKRYLAEYGKDVSFIGIARGDGTMVTAMTDYGVTDSRIWFFNNTQTQNQGYVYQGWGYFSNSNEPSPLPIVDPIVDSTDFVVSNGVLIQYNGGNKYSSITIPDGVTAIADDVFRNNEKLIGVTIPDGVTSIGNYAFAGCSNLNSINIPESVSVIGEGAFSGCINITDIHIPEGITSIEDHTFDGCISLYGLTIPDSVTSIGNYAFVGCRANLTEILIPDSVTFLGDYAFSGCENLTHVIIPNKLKSMGNNSFSGCSGLTDVIISDSVTAIGDYAFSDCWRLNNVIIPNSVNSIGKYAFSNCSGLTDLTISDKLESIGQYAFQGCTSLENVTIPDSVSSIEKGAFSGSGLTSITIPNSVESISHYAFYECINLKRITIPNSVSYMGQYSIPNSTSDHSPNWYSVTDKKWYTPDQIRNRVGIADTYLANLDMPEPTPIATLAPSDFIIDENGVLTAYSGTAENVVIPDDVKGIGSNVFQGNSTVKEVVIPDSVLSIGDYAFYECSSLTSINIPTSVTSIGDYSFYGCSSLTGITIPGSVISVGNHAFQDCKGLGNITISAGVSSIGDWAFAGCNYWRLERITIPASVTSLGSDVFNGCTNLQSVSIYSSLTSIPDGMFNECYDLTNVTIPTTVTSIGDRAFRRCTSLSYIKIPEGVTAIGAEAFYYCEKLNSITLPVSLTSIGNYAFCYCDELKSISLPVGLASIGTGAFEYCSGLTSVTLPVSLTSIGDYAFCDCDELENISLPAGLTSIGTGVFSGCSGLKSVILLDSLSTIGKFAFSRCDGLTSISLPSGLTSIRSYAFNECTGLTNIILPDGLTTIESYAFNGCKNLSEISIPTGMRILHGYAFNECYGLKSITIPASVTTIESNAIPDSAFENAPNWYSVQDQAWYTPAQIRSRTGIADTYLAEIGSDITKPVSYTVTFKVVNGSWDDGTTADKTVSLSGNEGDTLKLTASQIPAVGTKPNANYKAGSWDMTPTVNTAITQNTTYTYTYSTETESDLRLIVSAGKARPGEEVTVGVSIENNPGLAYINLGITYDETKLSYVGHEDSGLTGWLYGKGKISWDADENVDFNGEILKLKFKVLDYAEEGDAVVSVNSTYGNILGNDETVYIPNFESGKITVYKNIPGDITGDDVVDGRDLLRLKRHLVGLNVELVGNADTTGDGVIDGRDLLRLKRHLVGISVELH